MFSGPDRRTPCDGPATCGIGEMRGELGIIKELLSDHVEQSREERAEMRKELNEIKTEITKYKFLFRAVVGTVVLAATFQFGDIAALWH